VYFEVKELVRSNFIFVKDNLTGSGLWTAVRILRRIRFFVFFVIDDKFVLFGGRWGAQVLHLDLI